MLKNLAKTSIKRIEPLIFNNQDLLAAFLAYYVVGIRTPWPAAWNFVNNAVGEVVSQAQNTLQLEKASRRKAQKWLGSLCALAFVSQDEYFDAYFNTAFLPANSRLEIDNFSMTVVEIIRIIADATWNNPECAENPHIVALKDILEKLVQQE